MILSGKELAEGIQEKLRGTGKSLELTILRDSDNPVIMKYVNYKKLFGQSVGATVNDIIIPADEMIEKIEQLNKSRRTNGMIVQLPLQCTREQTEEILKAIAQRKDVDGLNPSTEHLCIPATAKAIDYLLTGNGIDLAQHKIAIVGYGKLVGAPLTELWRSRDLEVDVFRKREDRDLNDHLPNYDLIVTATGQAGLITSQMISPGTILIDAGTTTASNSIVGDVAEEVRDRDDITISAKYGGVGPLTVAMLFDNLWQTQRDMV